MDLLRGAGSNREASEAFEPTGTRKGPRRTRTRHRPAGGRDEALAEVLCELEHARNRALESMALEREAAKRGVARLLLLAQGEDSTIVGLLLTRQSASRVAAEFIRADGEMQIVGEALSAALSRLACPLQELATSIFRSGEETSYELRLEAGTKFELGGKEKTWDALWESQVLHTRAAAEHREALEGELEGSKLWSYHLGMEAFHLEQAARCKLAMNTALDRRERSLQEQAQRTGWSVSIEPMFENDGWFGKPDSPSSLPVGRTAEIRPGNGAPTLVLDQIKLLVEHLPGMRSHLEELLAWMPDHRAQFEEEAGLIDGWEAWEAAEKVFNRVGQRDSTEEPWEVAVKPLYGASRPGAVEGWRVGIWLPIDKQWGDVEGDRVLIESTLEILGALRGLYAWAEAHGFQDDDIWGQTLLQLSGAAPEGMRVG